ncbi:MAG: hypothetical protein LBK99_05065, partial [Opitutaceae bacterium]|nr:hypothetical protein [Opitutaceae bacterium]
MTAGRNRTGSGRGQASRFAPGKAGKPPAPDGANVVGNVSEKIIGSAVHTEGQVSGGGGGAGGG